MSRSLPMQRCLLLLLLAVGFVPGSVAFVPLAKVVAPQWRTTRGAGGFEWNDPTEAFDQGVENPYKNPALTEGEGGAKIDPARLLPPRLGGVNLYMIGMMGCGKTSIGKKLAKRMGTYSFLDTDKIAEEATGMKVPEIFAEHGEEEFRTVEQKVLSAVYPYVRCVISTGGGIVCNRDNWSKLHTGITVWLDVPPRIIWDRIKNSKRPLLQTDNPRETVEKILAERKELYSQADVHVRIDRHIKEDEMTDLVIRCLHDYIDDNPPAWKVAKAKAQAEGLDWVN